MSNAIAPGSSADVNVQVRALGTDPNVSVQYKTVILKKNIVNGVNTLTQAMMSDENTKYVIKYDYVLGSDIIVPANCILEFNGGSIGGKLLYLSNNCSIIGKGKFILGNDSYSNSLASFDNLAAGIIAEAVSNIYIDGIEVVYDSSQENAKEGAAGILTYGFRNTNAKNIKIINCSFKNCGVSINSATINSKVTHCDFESDNAFVYNFETVYDEQLPPDQRGDGYYGWNCPKNGIFSYNNVVNTCPNIEFALMWCSGLENLEISHNNFTCTQQLLELYCGDGSVHLSNARFTDNSVFIVDGSTRTKRIYYIHCGGESYQTPRMGRVISDVTIERNLIKDCRSNKTTNVGIEIILVDKIIVRNNVFEGFLNSLYTDNNFAGKLILYKSDYIIENNKFINSYDTPINIAKNAKSYIIRNNYFNNCTYRTNNFWVGVLDIIERVNVSIINNHFYNVGTKPILYTKNSQNAVGWFIISKGNTKDGVPSNGSYFQVGNVTLIENQFGYDNGMLSDTSIVDNIKELCYRGKNYIIVSNNVHKLYKCTRSGSHYGKQATLLPTNAGLLEIEYDNGETMNLSTGCLITINDKEYTITNIYTKSTYQFLKDIEAQTEQLAISYIIVLDRPLEDAITEDTIVYRQKAAFVDALGNPVTINSSGDPVDNIYPSVIGTPTTGNLAMFNGTNIEDAGKQ